MLAEISKYYKIAGIRYRVIIDSSYPYEDEGVLSEYIDEPDENSYEIRMKITEVLPTVNGEIVFDDNNKFVVLSEDGTRTRYEGASSNNKEEAYMCIRRDAESSCVYIKPRAFGSKTVLKAMELEHFTAINKSVLFHSAYISVNGKAILFTAPSGVGKSTQADLWVKHKNAELVNGDRCILTTSANKPMAFGVPYCGSSRVNHNVTLEVAAIVYLVQAPYNCCSRLHGLAAFKKIWEGICVNIWDRSDVEAVIQTVTELAQRVPIILLECTPDVSAAEALQSFMKELNI